MEIKDFSQSAQTLRNKSESVFFPLIDRSVGYKYIYIYISFVWFDCPGESSPEKDCCW